MNLLSNIHKLQQRIEQTDPLRIRNNWLTYLLIVLLFIIAWMSSYIPFINIALPFSIAMTLVIIFAVATLRLPAQAVFIGALALLSFALLVTLAGREDVSEQIGTIVYLTLWYGAYRYFFFERDV